MKKGLLIIISGPSGVGKGTVRNYFMNDGVIEIGIFHFHDDKITKSW